VSAVERKRERRRLARIVLPVGEVQLRCLLDSGVEVSLIDCEVLKCLDPWNYVLDDNKEDTFLSINGSEFVSVGKAVVTLASGNKVPFVVASDLVHEVVLAIDILDNATLDLAHGVVVIPKLAFEGQLERGGVGAIFAVCKETAAVKGLKEVLDKYAELFGPYPVDGCAMEPVDVSVRVKDPDKVVWVPPRRLSQREEEIVDEEVDELLKMGVITRSTSPFNTPIVVVEQKGKSRVSFDCHVFESCWKGCMA